MACALLWHIDYVDAIGFSILVRSGGRVIVRVKVLGTCICVEMVKKTKKQQTKTGSISTTALFPLTIEYTV